MLIRLITSVRKKPKHVRDLYAFWAAVVFTTLVAVPVVFGLPGRLDPASITGEADAQPMFSSFMDEVSERFSEATEPISDLRETIEATDPVSTTTQQTETVSSSTPVTEAPPAAREIRIATTTTSDTP